MYFMHVNQFSHANLMSIALHERNAHLTPKEDAKIPNALNILTLAHTCILLPGSSCLEK